RHPVPPAMVATRWHRTRSWLWSVYFLGLWLLWVIGTMKLFWLAAVVAGLPFAAWIAQRAVNNVLRPAGTDHSRSEVPGVLAAIINRAIRALFIIAAIFILAWGWDVDLTMMADRDTFVVRLVRGIFTAVVIALIADFIWHIGRTLIDKRITDA